MSPCMVLRAESETKNSSTKMMTTEVAQAGIASVSQSITAMTKMAMTRCCTTVSPSMPKQSMGRFHTRMVNRAVRQNISAFLRLKSPVNTFLTLSCISLCF